MIDPLGAYECRRHFGGSPQPQLPPTEKAPTAADPATKARTDAALALAKRQALAGRSMNSTRHVTPTLGMPRTSVLLGGGMGPA